MIYLIGLISLLFADPNMNPQQGVEGSFKGQQGVEGAANGVDCCHLPEGAISGLLENTNPDENDSNKTSKGSN